MPLRTTLGDLLHDCAATYNDRPFLTIVETGQTLSYREFESLCNRIAHGLLEQQLGDLSYIAILAENSAEYLATTYALKKINSVEVSINRAMQGAPLTRMIDQTGAGVLITTSEHLEALDQVRDDIIHVHTLVLIDNTEAAQLIFPQLKVIAFDDLLSEVDSHLVSPASDTDTATILFTSGTTGVSKGCLLSHRYAVRTAENMIAPFRLTADDCSYSPYPLSHIGPAYYDVLPMMMVGGQVVLRQGFSLSSFWPEIKRYGVTWFMMLGSVQQLLWSQPPCREETDHQVTRCWGTPAPVPKRLFDDRFGLHLIPGGGYGSTDAGWVVVPQWDHPGGIVLPHFEVGIVNDSDDLLPANTPGELVVRPLEPGVMSDGYFGMPERTLESRRNLLFHTGDIGRLDEQGRFYFMHRISERIRVKGEMVSAYEVEEAVLTHPGVADCAAIGIPGELGEEDIRLFVVKKSNVHLTTDELRQHCASRMANFMIPKVITFLDNLPRTTTGKAEKGKLAELK